MPEAEAALLREVYAGAEVILEYGSGGSTLIAAQSARRVFSVESDAAWLAKMEGWFAAHPARAELSLHHGDIGPTAAWGRPKDDSAFLKWPSYATSVWARDDFTAPDVVLIDGRFRPACFATVALSITKPVTVLFDDYARRPAYHTIEHFAAPIEMVGRMARFELAPQTFRPADLAWLVGLFLRPN